ncbi:hypothetical protein [Photobacterium phosphoreum]|uniref:hypothetical protein n=1 Tax=Photobacterium phosphoreum TaxID=659 RepID=UPI001E413420|nr:hypothetical protein [Photobacterium phosphoreum]MCD9471332.1 hypothetical protein [Photobacterium phosphoreum]
MKILKVEPNGIPTFSLNGFDWKNIDVINKDDISEMLNLCIHNEVILEEYDNSLIKNPAQKIIYSNIHSKFKEFIEDKANFKDQVDSLYKDALEKYK